ncbi:MAG: sodium:solute symporter family protein [Acidilobaceae archaeon]|nr:sodium:solute symporter family protein [Acidilobaceae archaeon]MCX8165823.1 sodium:solute symporter family protein [Acidilobaceae archaeon]MDW7974247.1 sodium:solute symporter family protein [Sulfolobales archaeon]
MLPVLLFIIYIVLGTLIAVYSRRFMRPGERDFYVGSYRVGGLVAALTYAATTYSAFMMVGLVGLSYATGVGAHGFELLYLVATVAILIIFAPRVWERARERGWITPSDMLSDHYGSKLIGIVVALIYLISLVPYTALQMKGIGEIFGKMMGGEEHYGLGVLFGALLVLIWSLIAGIWSVALTDAFQGLFMLLAGTLYFFWLFLLVQQNIGLAAATELLANKGLLGMSSFWTPHVFLSFTLPWMLFAVIHPQVVQRLFIPRDREGLALMVRGFAVFGLLYTVLAVTIGLLARAAAEGGLVPYVEPSRRDLVTPTLLTLMHPLLSSLIFVSIIAAAVTTANSIVLSLAGVAARELGFVLPEERRMKLGYLAAAFLVAVAASVAYARVGYIVDLAVLTTTMLLPLAPVTLLAWLNVRVPAWSAILSLLAGFSLVVFLMMYYGKPMQVFLLSIYGLPSSVAVLLLSSLFLAVGWAFSRKS